MDSPRAGVDARLVGGRYRLIEPLGSGGMGTVWRAEDAVLGRHVAVKEVVFPHGLSDADRATLRERTRREARAAARLDQPSAVTVYDVVEQDGQPWLVLELVEARTLAEVVRADGPLTPQRTAEVGVAVLGALEAAHRAGIVHRDVKPSNVLLADTGRVVLTDFGIATSPGDSQITSTGLLLGSPSYIAPERARGATPGPPSDLWSLGATLFTAVEGRPPYDKGEPLPTLQAVVTGDQEPYVAAGPLVPVLDGLLAADPAQRLDAGAARRLLERIATTTPTSPLPRPQPAPVAEQRAEQTSALPLPAAAPVPPVPAAAPERRPLADVPRRQVAARQPRRTGAVVGVLAGLLALGGVGYGVSTLGDAGSTSPPSGAPSAGASSGSAGDDASSDGSGSEGSGSDDAPTVPAGFTAHTGEAGWTVAVPQSYAPGSYKGQAQYRDPATGRTLRVSTGKGVPDAVADREEAASTFARTHDDYQQIAITGLTYRDSPAADWEFTYSAGGAQLHVLNRVADVDGTGHSLYFQTRASDWPAAKADFDAIVAAFRPAGR